jgi:hypothetical protein
VHTGSPQALGVWAGDGRPARWPDHAGQPAQQ